MSYTYYGDLLGVSGYYKLSHSRAYDRLNDFYNTTFSTLRSYCRNNSDIQVRMFSDTLLIWGDSPTVEILKELHKLYIRLIRQGLLLRGAIVRGELGFDYRLTLINFNKELPLSNTLARAVGLEKTARGSRLFLENSLVEELFETSNCSSWMTPEGYTHNLTLDIPLDSPLRRICPEPNLETYELLYFWTPRRSSPRDRFNRDSVRRQLLELSSMLSDEFSLHYKETLSLLDRSLARKEFTEQYAQSIH